MRARLQARDIFAVCAAWLVLASFSSQASTPILFIGNSFIYINGGIDTLLDRLAPSSKASRLAMGGFTLEKHWNDGNARQTIRKGHWGYVILQEQSQTPVFDPGKFRGIAREFDQEIRRSGAKTVLLMTWERPDSVKYGVTTANLAAAYNAVGTELGVKVAPVGLAFAHSLRVRPNLLLYSQDGHPTMYGTYLAACVLYGTIFDHSPVGIPYSDKSIPTELRGYFQRIAAESLGY